METIVAYAVGIGLIAFFAFLAGHAAGCSRGYRDCMEDMRRYRNGRG